MTGYPVKVTTWEVFSAKIKLNPTNAKPNFPFHPRQIISRTSEHWIPSINKLILCSCCDPALQLSSEKLYKTHLHTTRVKLITDLWSKEDTLLAIWTEITINGIMNYQCNVVVFVARCQKVLVWNCSCWIKSSQLVFQIRGVFEIVQWGLIWSFLDFLQGNHTNQEVF